MFITKPIYSLAQGKMIEKHDIKSYLSKTLFKVKFFHDDNSNYKYIEFLN